MNIQFDPSLFSYPDVVLPPVWLVEQTAVTPALPLDDVAKHARRCAEELLAPLKGQAGAEVCLGVGSRGVANLQAVVRAVVKAVEAAGHAPFIVPAMGSHGGATPAGQLELLASYGITLEGVGAEVRATMETVELGQLAGPDSAEFPGHTVMLDRNAAGAAGILLINRIKPHTDFRAPIESGLAKMCAIGLGKRVGAEAIHRHGAYGLQELMPRVARYIADHAPVLGGIALLENELGQTAEVHAIGGDGIGRAREEAMLERAREMTPRLPFDELDVLVLDEMGKNISGAGMDTHVIGRGNMPSIPEQTWGGPDIRLIAVLDLTPESHGNATALGLADLTTQGLIEKTDWAKTFTNLRTSGEGGVLRGRIPLILPDSEACVQTAIATCGCGEYGAVRLARVRNTADMRLIEITEPLLEAAQIHPGLRIVEGPRKLDLRRPPR